MLLGLICAALAAPGYIVLHWSKVEGAKTYELEVDETQQFGRARRAKTNKDEAVLLFPEGAYFARVRAVDEGGAVGPWSALESFQVFAKAPSQISPGNGDLVYLSDQPKVRFRWGDTGYDRYLLLIKGRTGEERIWVKGVSHTWVPPYTGNYAWEVLIQTGEGLRSQGERHLKVRLEPKRARSLKTRLRGSAPGRAPKYLRLGDFRGVKQKHRSVNLLLTPPNFMGVELQ